MKPDARDAMTAAESDVPASLRAHFFRHNLTALLLAVLSLVSAAAFWTVLYLLCYWLTLLVLTIRLGDDAHAPGFFPLAFAAAAFALCLIAAALRWLQPHEQTGDAKPFWKILADFLLIVPRMMFAAWGNLSACRLLSRREMALAWTLLQKIAAERQVPVQSVAVDIPDARARDNIVLALRIADLIYLKKTDAGFFLAMQGGKMREIAVPKVRIEAGENRGTPRIGD